MNRFETQILNIHDAFLLEYSRTLCQLEELQKVVTSFIGRIVIEETDNENHFQMHISKLQDICFFLKSFCGDVEAEAEKLTPRDIDKIKTEDVIEEKLEMNNVKSTELPDQTDNLNKILPYEVYSEIFTYDTIDPPRYKIGYEAEFPVAYIKDGVNGLFFLMDSSRSDFVIKQPDFRYDIIPDKGIIFGLLLDGIIVRAVRENSLKKPPISFRVLLIDFGEILEITKDYKMYRLPEQLQKIPGQAIFCKLIMDVNCDDQSCLDNSLHTKQKIRIEGILGNMLEVKFLSTETLTMSETSISSTTNIVVNSDNTSFPVLETTLETNEGSIISTCSTIKSNKNGLTQEQIDDLYEEPLNTENALEAVMGYVPQDEKRICKFFDPKTNACFKGANCQLEHTTILKDGWTKDKSIIKLKIRSEIPMPKVGKKINLLISYVVDVEKFYGQIVHKNCKSFEDLTVKKIIKEMNNDKLKSKLKSFTLPPGEFELVFALFTDNLWYRAKILQKITDLQYKVFYVDYGNCSNVTLDQIRKWEDEFDCYPFQALECRLDNVTKVRESHKDAIAYFENLVLNKPVKATVTYNIQRLHVILQDQSQFDIGEQLCVLNFAQQKPITEPITGQIPG